MEDVSISIRQKFNYCIIDINGPITFNNAAGLKNYVDTHLPKEAESVVLNLERVTFIDSTALSLLIELMEQFSRKKSLFYLMNPNTRVEGLLVRANLKKYFRFIDSEAALTKRARQEDLNTILDEPL